MRTPFLRIVPVEEGPPHPFLPPGGAGCSLVEGGDMEGVGVSEIHRYPLRPEGFEEPLFPTAEARMVVAQHLLCAPWLCRASEAKRSGRGGQAVRALEEPIEVEGRAGEVILVRSLRGRRGCRTTRRMVETLARWREVGGWWSEEEARDRVVVRVLLSDGAVVDLAREDGAWSLVSVVD